MGSATKTMGSGRPSMGSATPSDGVHEVTDGVGNLNDGVQKAIDRAVDRNDGRQEAIDGVADRNDGVREAIDGCQSFEQTKPLLQPAIASNNGTKLAYRLSQTNGSMEKGSESEAALGSEQRNSGPSRCSEKCARKKISRSARRHPAT